MNEGRKVEKEFNDEFGAGMATFAECDVRDKEKFEGNYSKVCLKIYCYFIQAAY